MSERVVQAAKVWADARKVLASWSDLTPQEIKQAVTDLGKAETELSQAVSLNSQT